MTKRVPGAVRGRPKGSAKFTERILLPVDLPLLAALDAMAEELCVGRAEMIRGFCERAVKAHQRRKSKTGKS